MWKPRSNASRNEIHLLQVHWQGLYETSEAACQCVCVCVWLLRSLPSGEL